ncbi:MAG: phage holin family protein [Anaerolineales bacterium]|nr:phage holin family protein [Anaerolineales bacterium]
MNLRYILIRWIISAIAIMATTYLMPGITIEGNGILAALAVAFILGLVNAVIRPILVLLSCGCIVATLGLFMLVINALTLMITSSISQAFGINFYVDGFMPALFGSIIISIITWLLSLFLIGEDERG